MTPRRHASILLLLPLTLALGGCAAAVPLVSAASAGAAAGEAGFSFWRSGMLTYVDEGTMDEMNEAVAITIDRLALEIRETKDQTEWGVLASRWWSIRSDRGHLVTIKVEPLTSAMIEVEIDAGRFGNKAAAELIADRCKNELDQIQARIAPGVTHPGP
jgi:hypothetical protein